MVTPQLATLVCEPGEVTCQLLELRQERVDLGAVADGEVAGRARAEAAVQEPADLPARCSGKQLPRGLR